MRVVRHWNKFPREAVEKFRAKLDGALNKFKKKKKIVLLDADKILISVLISLNFYTAAEFYFEHVILYCNIKSQINKEKHFQNNGKVFYIVDDDIKSQRETFSFI